MTNWSKLTVAKLKDECSERAISLTGLKLKQHFIDKLEEWEASQPDGETKERSEEDENANGEVEEVQPERTPAAVDKNLGYENTSHINGHSEEGQQTPDTGNKVAAPQAEPSSALVNDQPEPQELPEAETQPLAPEPSQDAAPAATGVPEAVQNGQVAVEDKEQTNDEDQADANAPKLTPPTDEERRPSEDAVNENAQMEGQDSADQTPASASVPPPPPTHDSTRSSSVVPPAEISEDARKRKRRSVTPTPQAEEIASKKAKANDGSPLIRAKVEAENEQAAIDAAGVDADAGPLAHQQPAADIQLNSEPRVSPVVPRDVRSASPVDERTVAPASHPATSTLYIRNFKRPLRQPDLQTHIASLARSSRDDPDSNPIKFFYLDVLRTHALIRLQSISAACRVRAAIHDTRWPDEPTRDLLWADFIPDDKAETWANQEADASAGSGFGSRGSGGKRWEVIYQEGPDGVEAILQDANEVRTAPQHRQPSFSQDRKPSAAWEREPAPGIHPDRAALVSSNNSRTSSRRLDDRPPSVRQPKNAEKSFAALDELFSSTEKTKPKLYYKPVASQVIDERMELIKDLRVGHNGMGRSGDDGMKRYTFEWERGKQDWADKGPEFGFGRKGQERLAGGRGRGGGGFRGRGGGGFGYPRGGGGGGGAGGGGRGGGDRYMDLDAPPPSRRGGDGWRGGY